MKQFNFMIMLVAGRVNTFFVNKDVTVVKITEKSGDSYKDKFVGGCEVKYAVDNGVYLYEDGELGYGEGDDGIIVAFGDNFKDTWETFAKRLLEDGFTESDVADFNDMVYGIKDGGSIDW